MLKKFAAVCAFAFIPAAALAQLPTYPFIHVTGSASLTAAPDIGVPVETTWQTRVQQGSAATPATIGVDFEAGLVGVNGLPRR